jgi:uncharacterized protein (TIGR03067 family)
MARRTAWFCLLVPLLTAANTERPDTSLELSDVEQLQGTWKLESKQFNSGGWHPCDVKINGNAVVGLLSWGDPGDHQFTVKVMPGKGEATFSTLLGNEKLRYEAIYKIEGDKLTICLDRDVRPTKFSPQARQGALLLVYKRGKG